MEREELRELVIDMVTAIQMNSGRPLPAFADGLRPLEDVDGFDSLNAEEATTMLSVRLGLEISDNPFIQENKALRLSQVVDRLLAAVHAGG